MSLAVRTCEDAAPWLGALHDGELEADERAAVQAHVAGCAACQGELAALSGLTTLVRDVVPLPPPDVWRTFDAELAAELCRAAPAHAAGGRVVRLRPLLAAAAAMLAAVALPLLPEVADPSVRLSALPAGVVPAALPYRDPARPVGPGAAAPSPPPLEVGAIEARTGLPRADAARLRERWLVQVRAPGATRLSDLYPSGPDAPQAYVTADVALALLGATCAGAADAVEREVLAPGLRALLAATLRELRALELATDDPALRAGARRAREVLGVAALLAGAEPSLPRDALARARAEAARVEAAAGEAPSPVLGRAVDYRAFAPFERAPDEDDLAPHRRAAAWLSRAGLRQDAAQPDEVRAAALLGLAVARARVAAPGGGEESALVLLERLEAALEVLHGPPDALGPRQALVGASQALGADPLLLSSLAPADAPARLAERARVEAEARGRERVRGPRADGDAPVVRLLGGTRGLEAEALTRLSAPALPGRGAPSALDILAVLGSRRARTVVSAERGDAPGYDEVLARIAEEAAAWRDPTRPVPARACLEQGRLWSIAALLDDEAAPVAHAAWRDRRLLCALAALVPQGPPAPVAPDEAPAPPGPCPRVEPLPRVHARLAFTAGRVAAAVEALVPRPGPRVRDAVARLRRAADLLRALRDAASAELERRAPAPEVEAALRGFGAALRDLEPAAVTVAEEVFVSEGADGARVLHRAVAGVDALWVVVLDLRTGAPRLVRGAALAPRVVWTEGARPRAREALALEAARGAPAPAWATHLGGGP